MARGQFKKGGRPVGSQRCYEKKNKPIEAPSLRRDPTAHEKLRIIKRYEEAAQTEGVEFIRLSLTKRQELQRGFNWHWDTIKMWYSLKPIMVSTIAKLRLGVRGLRPFGSNKKLTECKRNKGARIQQTIPGKVTKQRPLEAVMYRLEKWFKREREYNHEVRKKTILTHLKGLLEQERDIQLVKQQAPTASWTFEPISLRACQERLQTFDIIHPSENQDKWFEKVVAPRIGVKSKNKKIKMKNQESSLKTPQV